MSLFTDSDHITADNMAAIDPEVPDIASAEDILLDGPTGIIRQAWDECADKILEYTQSFDGSLYVSSAWAATGTFSSNRPRVRLNRIVVSSQFDNRESILRRWMVYTALTMFYRAASNRRESDRYQKKYERAIEDTKIRWRSLFASGLPIVSLPLSCPGAIHDSAAGEFGDSNLSHVPGGASAETKYDVTITWVDSSNYVGQTSKGNAESGPSRTVEVTVPLNELLSVNIAGLAAPGSAAYQGGFADGLFTSRKATGWNVYVGSSGGKLYLQNSTPIPVGTTSYALSGAPVLSGYQIGPGQFADANTTFSAVFSRA